MYLGVDGFINGWCCSSFNEEMIISIKPAVETIFIDDKFVRILIDIPIGLSSIKFKRKIDYDLRKLLPKGRKNSVFNAPSRISVYSKNYHEAKMNELCTNGKSISIQSWNISNKIKEVDEFLCLNPKFLNLVHESHPELCFYYLNQKTPLSCNKKTNEGIKERIEILSRYYKNSHEVLYESFNKYKKHGLKKDDIADAMALSISAKNWVNNGKRTIEHHPKIDEKGIPIGIYF